MKSRNWKYMRTSQIIKKKCNVSLFNIFIDQVITGDESKYMTENQIREGIERFREDSRSSEDLYSKMRIHVWNSIHYHYINDPKKWANEYEKVIGVSNQVEHSRKIFDSLIQNFNLESFKNYPILVEENKGKLQILDGAHRLALFFYQTQSTILDVDFLSYSQLGYREKIGIRDSIILKARLKAIRGSFFPNSWAVTREFPAGYHAFDTYGFKIKGQRDNKIRLTKLKKIIDLEGRSIIDFGCNTGGLLFHWPSPSHAVGLDFDTKAIGFANAFVQALRKLDFEVSRRFEFYVQDLDNLDYTILGKMMRDCKVDTVLLLSIGSWVKSWKDLYSFLSKWPVDIILETNNDVEGLQQIQLFVNLGKEISLISDSSNDDNSGNYGRKTYLIKNHLGN